MTSIRTATSHVRSTIDEQVQNLGNAGHEVIVTTAGLVALSVDQTRRIWREREIVKERAQSRGVEIEAEIIALARDAEEEMKERLASLRPKGGVLRSPMATINAVAKRVRNRVDARLERYGVRPAEVPVQEIKITRSEPVTDSATVGSEISPPWADYGSMTAKDIVRRLSDLDEVQLRAVDAYEATHANRITVLRAVAKLLDPTQR